MWTAASSNAGRISASAERPPTGPTALASHERSQPSNLWFEIENRIQAAPSARPRGGRGGHVDGRLAQRGPHVCDAGAPAHKAHRACRARTISAFKPLV